MRTCAKAVDQAGRHGAEFRGDAWESRPRVAVAWLLVANATGIGLARCISGSLFEQARTEPHCNRMRRRASCDVRCMSCCNESCRASVPVMCTPAKRRASIAEGKGRRQRIVPIDDMFIQALVSCFAEERCAAYGVDHEFNVSRGCAVVGRLPRTGSTRPSAAPEELPESRKKLMASEFGSPRRVLRRICRHRSKTDPPCVLEPKQRPGQYWINFQRSTQWEFPDAPDGHPSTLPTCRPRSKPLSQVPPSPCEREVHGRSPAPDRRVRPTRDRDHHQDGDELS